MATMAVGSTAGRDIGDVAATGAGRDFAEALWIADSPGGVDLSAGRVLTGPVGRVEAAALLGLADSDMVRDPDSVGRADSAEECRTGQVDLRAAAVESVEGRVFTVEADFAVAADFMAAVDSMVVIAN